MTFKFRDKSVNIHSNCFLQITLKKGFHRGFQGGLSKVCTEYSQHGKEWREVVKKLKTSMMSFMDSPKKVESGMKLFTNFVTLRIFYVLFIFGKLVKFNHDRKRR